MSHVFFLSFFFFSFWTKCWSKSVEGLLSTGPTPSSFIRYQQFQLLYLSVCIGRRKGLVHSLLGEVIDYPNQTLDYHLATYRQSHLQSHILVPQKTHVVHHNRQSEQTVTTYSYNRQLQQTVTSDSPTRH